MRHGYLTIESRADRSGLVRIFGSETQSPPATVFPQQDDRPRLLYCALFHDLDGALMHTHEPIRRHLVDLNHQLYSVDPLDAVAAAQSVELRHWQTYIDAELADDPGLAGRVASLLRRKKRSQLLWKIVGIIAIVWMLLKSVPGIW